MLDIDALRAHAQADLERWRVPGLELVVVKDKDVLLAEGFGLRNVAGGLPVTPLTRFHHGSTGKAFTGVLCGALVDSGLLEWDRPVREYLPDFRLHDEVLSQRITVTDLLSHRSGLARHELMWVANPSFSRAELVRRLRYLPSNLDLRSSFTYCNLAFAVVGQLIASLTGSSWEEQMRKRVLEPLGMAHTITSVEEAQALEHAQPYSAASGRKSKSEISAGDQWKAIPWRQSDQIAPAGQMISCATDMACWLRLQLGDGDIDGKRIISAAALAHTKRLHTPIDGPGPDPDIHFYGYAFGWVLGTYRGHRLVWHNGGIDGFKTDIALLPDDGAAVAVSCNVHQTDMPFALAFHVLDSLLGVDQLETGWPAKPWSENLLGAIRSQPKPPKPPVTPGTKPSHPLKEYAGVYEHPGYGTFTIAVRGRSLRARLGELDLTARHRHFDTWTLTYEPLEASWPLTFLTNTDGQICAAEMPLESSTGPIRFEEAPKEAAV